MLTRLNLEDWEQLEDLVPLSRLKSLTSLDLSCCWKLTDIGPLSGLESLESLDLSGCASVTDLSPLSGLKSLRVLDLTECDGLPREHQRLLQGAELKASLSALGAAGKTRTTSAKKGDKKTP